MKIFISWSGETSKNMAEVLKKWIPCFFESAEVFFSPEDIEKGQNWNKRITEELSDCNYGIVCMTSENKNAPWVNFEAGAIAKAFDSRVAALLVDVNPSDIQGPLSMFQATKLVKDDVFKLIKSINNCLEHPRNEDTLKNLFGALWEGMNKDFKELARRANLRPDITLKQKTNENITQKEILESILQAVREQSRILSNPENILPKEYLSKFIEYVNRADLRNYISVLIESLVGFLSELLNDNGEERALEHLEEIVRIVKYLAQTQQISGFNDKINILQREIKKIKKEIIEHDSEFGI